MGAMPQGRFGAETLADEFDPFASGPLARVLSTSEVQREVWLADQLGGAASLAFNEAVRLTLDGPLDLRSLHGAIDRLVARHESLRTSFGPEGHEAVVAEAGPVDVPVFDLRALPADARDARVAQAERDEARRPFDVARGPLFRAALYRLSERSHVLLMAAHHLVCDGWSWVVIVEDLGALYAEQRGEAPAPDPAPTYADYLDWEAQQATSLEQAEHLRYWLGRYDDAVLPALDLPTDRPRPPTRQFDSQRIDQGLDAALVARLRKHGAGLGASLFSTVFAGFAALLHRLTGQSDLVIGVPAAGQSASGLHGLVGHCVNLLPLRLGVDGSQPWEALVRDAGRTVLDAFDHQAMTYGTLLQQLPVARDPSRLPLVSVMFNLDQASGGAQGFPGLRTQLAGLPRCSENFELFLNLVPVPEGGLRLECQYNTRLFDAATVAGWLQAYEGLLRAAVDAPSEAVQALPWLGAEAVERLRALQPEPTPLPPFDLMHHAFEREAAATPQAVALADANGRLTYAELDARANRLAHALRARGVRRGQCVGLCLSRSNEMVVALLAVLKAGATYVPLDPGFPPARLAYYAQDAALVLLVTESTLTQAPLAWRHDAADRVLRLDTDTAWQQSPDTALAPSDADATPNDAAYVIYTSGSTGQPKGVCVPHGAVVNFLASMRREPGLGADDTLAAVTTLSFDIAVLELMLPLAVGARVLVVPRDTLMDGLQLDALLRREGVTAMQATPGVWRLLLDAGWPGHPGFKALVGGEAFPVDLAQSLLQRCGEVWNLYGPTETTVWSTAWRVEADALAAGGMAIGRPIDNTQVWVLNEALQPCPIGVAGELCIGGAGVTLGYHQRPDLTADRFVDDPFHPGAKLYRTGDLGRWRHDGLLRHLGRIDAQVKVRGYRIELGEIEAACEAVDGVAESVVAAREDQPGDVRLVAYLRLAGGAALSRDHLRARLAERLPDYMLPQHVVVLDAIPRLPNGKVDRRQLPAPDVQGENAAGATRDPVAPRDETEAAVLAAMAAVLAVPGLGVHDDFFALGGHSLLAARLTSRLNRELELNLPLRTLFESPTAEKLAQAVAVARRSSGPKRAPLVAQTHRREAPLTPMQERIRFMEAMTPGRVVYNTPSGHRLKGPMDAVAFERALQEIVRRQPSLRTDIGVGVGAGGEPLQRVHDTIEVRLPVIDLTHLPVKEREPELMRRMQAIVDTPFDLHDAPLFRAVLYRLADDEHAFLFMPHHLVWDGWSFDLLYDELGAIYSAFVEGRPSPLAPLAITYGDYAEWHAQWMRGEEYAAQLAFWKARYAAAPAVRAPGTDKPRRRGMTGEGAAAWVHVDAALTERLRDVARQADVTLNMLTMAVYAAMLADVTGHPALTLGVPVRGRLMAELEPVMGFFNNLLPVTLGGLDGAQPFMPFLRGLKQDLLNVFSHQDVPFERLALEREVASRSQAGLYQALFSFQDARGRNRQWGALQHQSILLFQKGATEDLGLWLMEVPGGLEGGFLYNADLYTPETAAAFRTRYLALLQRLVDAPPDTLADLLGDRDAPTRRALAHLEAAAPASPVRPATAAAPSAPLTAQEAAIVQAWAGVLDVPARQIGRDTDFFALGGSSLMAMAALHAVEQSLSVKLPASAMAAAPTVRRLATLASRPAGVGSLVPLRAAQGPARPAVFLVHDADGQTLLYRNLALRLDPGHAVYGLQPLAGDNCPIVHTRIEAMAAHYVQQIRATQSHGPYLVGGLCAGGVLAFEIALQLQAQGEQVGMVALIDAADVAAAERFGRVTQQRLQSFKGVFQKSGEVSAPAFAARSVATVVNKAKRLVTYEAKSRLARLQDARKLRQYQQNIEEGRPMSPALSDVTVRQVYNAAALDYAPRGLLAQGAVLFRATEGNGVGSDRPAVETYTDPLLGWQKSVATPIACFDVPGGHSSMLQTPHVDVLASLMQDFIDRSLAADRSAQP